MREEDAKHILKKGYVITAITLVSRPLGYLREAIQAYVFGATVLVDAFIVAFNFPELIQTIIFTGASSAILVPICTKYLKDEKEFSLVYSTFLNISLLITLLFSVLAFFFSESIVKIIAPGFSPSAKALTKNLFVLMLPTIVAHGMLSVIKSFLNAKDHFAAPELSGILWNVVFILFCLFLSSSFGIYSLAIGVSFGSFLQVAMQYPFLRKNGIRYTWKIDFSHDSLREAKRLFIGALIGASILPINGFVDRLIASFLPEGHVASLAYAFRVFILPFSLFAVPVYTVAFSSVSRLYHERNLNGLFSHIDNAIILLTITLIPSLGLMCGLSTEIVKILYERGAFSAFETELTARALLGYAIGLLFYGSSVLFTRIFYAMHDTKTPAIVGLVSVVSNAILDVLLMIPYKNFGISLATSIVSFSNTIILFLILKRKVSYRLERKTVTFLAQGLVCGIIIWFFTFLTKFVTKNPVFLIFVNVLFAGALMYGCFGRFFREILRSEVR
ncbi:MAG: murein biosynthesis integral membrane protein MurJ [Desulfobacterota bacterium]|nr:murein biosynthesis integral membrane protein MurJ [Thermodesulfobacteriota bacterium]MDW8002093.1 murein biosynthesis integral membrane protein MurJ [Deltaproteobacteria bacterium]